MFFHNQERGPTETGREIEGRGREKPVKGINGEWILNGREWGEGEEEKREKEKDRKREGWRKYS